jgi:hypothetical protein
MSTQPKAFIFVLMPFDSKFNDIYTFGIRGATQEVGAYAERVDEQMFTGGILDRIFNQISKADVIVADMTGRNPNVFYEVGYAHALGKVVLLLTQDTDDIPFDLKHRPHTVYGGQIETLRRELVPKIEWAIAEARRQQRSGGVEKFSIRVNGVDIPAVDASSPARADKDALPVIRGDVRSRSFHVPVHLRNDSFEAILGITHVYLFCRDASALVPCEYQTRIISGIADWGMLSTNVISEAPAKTTVPVRLDGFTAVPIDAPDALRSQFRLKTHFAAVPPGAVEEASIDLMFTDGSKSCDEEYRLRLHSAGQFYDFKFRMIVKFESPDPQTKSS